MSNILFIDQTPYFIVAESNGLREHDLYQKVRDEINRKAGPFSGSVDWPKIKQHCEALANDLGLDLLLTSYYAVACLKVSGLTSFVNALELVHFALSKVSEPDPKQAKLRKEALDWVNSKVIREIRDLNPDHEWLSVLYRCENYVERMHKLLEYQQKEYPVDFEGIAFVLFEHIDKIETRYQTIVKSDEEEKTQEKAQNKQKQKKQLSLSFLLGVAMAIGGYSAYEKLDWLRPLSYKQTQTVTNLNSPDNANALLLARGKTYIANHQAQISQLYSSSINNHLNQPIGAHLNDAINELSVLTTLYPNSSTTRSSAQSLNASRQEAIIHSEQFVEKFKEVRTRMANIALLARDKQWRQVVEQTQLIENFAISLSPVYGRVGYVEELITQGKADEAQKELDELKLRLNSLSWSVLTLEQALLSIQQTHEPSKLLPSEQ